MSISEAQKKAAQKYDAEKMKTIGLKVPIVERLRIEEAAEKANLKLATFCRACIKYCIDNNINLAALDKSDKP